jgi:putative ABC transport system permease protein
MRRTRAIRYVRLGLDNLLLHKLRSLLTMLGLVFGVGSVIAMLSVGEGASRQALDQIRKLGSNNIIIGSVKPSQAASQSGRARMDIYGITYADAQRIAETFSTVRTLVPVKSARQEMRYGDRTYEGRMVGTTADWFRIFQREVLAGRVLNADDVERRRNAVVLTEHGARQLLAARHTVGEFIRVGGNLFEVVGIVRNAEAAGGSVTMPDLYIDAYIPITVARERFGDVDAQRRAGSRSMELVELRQLVLEVDATERVEETAKAVEYLLKRTHRREDFVVSVPLALLRQAEQTRRTFNIVLGSIACISLLVGGIGIMNIMLASVTERTREIGIRRAIGARKGQIVGQFLIETVVLSTVGGLFGVGLGMAIPMAITAFSGMPTFVTTWGVLLSLGISVGIGLVFGIYPAFRAASLDPIVALRHE